MLNALLLQSSDSWWFFFWAWIHPVNIWHILGVIFLIWILFKRTRNIHHSDWKILLEGLKYSSKDFYERLRDELLSHKIESVATKHSFLFEKRFGTARRLYLQVDWGSYRYYVCAAPFGDSFFVSWHLEYKVPWGIAILQRIPIIWKYVSRLWTHISYYQADTASMFQTYCHGRVLAVIDELSKDNKGVRALTEDERKPIMKEVFKR